MFLTNALNPTPTKATASKVLEIRTNFQVILKEFFRFLLLVRVWQMTKLLV